MIGRRVIGLVVAGAITLIVATTLHVAGVSAQDFTQQQQNAASAQPNAGAPNSGAPDLFPTQNPTPGEAQAQPQNPAPSIDPQSPEAQAANDPNMEVLTKGTIHEA